MSDIKNFLKEKKQQNTGSNGNSQHLDDVNSKKKKDVQIKNNKIDDWNDDVFPDYDVKVKNYSEMKSKKQEKPSKVSGVSDWEKEITKIPNEENDENKVEEPVMKQVKAPEKIVKGCFADKIKQKTEKKKTQLDIEEEFFPALGVEVVKLPEPPKPKNEARTVVEEKKETGPRKFVNNKKPENTLQKPLETIAITPPEEKKPEPKSETKVSEGPRKFVSKKKDEKEQNQGKSQTDLKKEETERRIEEKLKEDEEKKKKITKAPFSDQKPEKEQTKPADIKKSDEKTSEDKDKKMIKFVNKKASNINNNAPLAQNLNSDNKEDVNETQAENLQKGEEDFKVIEKKKHEHVVAEKGKEKEGRFKIMKGKNEKENKTQKEQHPKKEKPVENNEPINNEPILEKKEEISKIVHFTALASTWD